MKHVVVFLAMAACGPAGPVEGRYNVYMHSLGSDCAEPVQRAVAEPMTWDLVRYDEDVGVDMSPWSTRLYGLFDEGNELTYLQGSGFIESTSAAASTSWDITAWQRGDESLEGQARLLVVHEDGTGCEAALELVANLDVP